MPMNRITESDSHYDHLETMTTMDLMSGINEQDKLVADAVKHAFPEIEKCIDRVVAQMKRGGRLFYIGAGTSGRLGILDASECPPTFGVDHNMVIGLIAGGDTAIRKAVEFAEDDRDQAWIDLQSYDISSLDVVIGIAASGTTPYVIGGLEACQENNITSGCITCNPDSPITKVSDLPIVAVVGPEFVTGSTRMKSGTAQKMILNMITTSVMIKLGKIKGNKMVDMQLSNDKLVDRGTKMIQKETNTNYEQAKQLLLQYGSVRLAVQAFINT